MDIDLVVVEQVADFVLLRVRRARTLEGGQTGLCFVISKQPLTHVVRFRVALSVRDPEQRLLRSSPSSSSAHDGGAAAATS